MQKELQIDIQWDNVDQIENTINLGESVTGKIIITPQVTLKVLHLKYHLIFETRGKLRQQKKTFYSHELCGKKQLHKGIEYPFDFEFINHSHETYKGKNFEQLIKLEVSIKLDRSVYSDGVLSAKGLRNFVKPYKEWSNSVYLNFSRHRAQHQVKDQRIQLDLANQITQKSCLLALSLLGLCILSGVFFNVNGLIITIPFSIWLVIHLQKKKADAMGNIAASFKHIDQGAFQVSLLNQKKWEGVQNIFARYEIVEKVIDTRGTSDITRVSSLYKSDIITLAAVKNLASIEFKYPDHTFLLINEKYCKVYWKLILNMDHSNKIPYQFSKKIDLIGEW